MKKIISLLVALLPIPFAALLLFVMIAFGLGTDLGWYSPEEETVLVIVALVVMVITAIVSIASVVYYIILAAINPCINVGIKVLWAFLFWNFAPLSMLVYWFMSIRTENRNLMY